jgi:hypothetical protein
MHPSPVAASPQGAEFFLNAEMLDEGNCSGVGRVRRYVEQGRSGAFTNHGVWKEKMAANDRPFAYKFV